MNKKTNKEIIMVAEILKMRAHIFICSYETAWERFVEEDEKQGFTYQEVFQYITNTAKERKNKMTMTAMQAFQKLKRLDNEVEALRLAIGAMNTRDIDAYYVNTVEQIMDSKLNYRKELVYVLENIELSKEFER